LSCEEGRENSEEVVVELRVVPVWEMERFMMSGERQERGARWLEEEGRGGV
jgi:hypothetical protein